MKTCLKGLHKYKESYRQCPKCIENRHEDQFKNPYKIILSAVKLFKSREKQKRQEIIKYFKLEEKRYKDEYQKEDITFLIKS